MQRTKELSQQNPYLVSRVSLIDSIKNIPVGVTVTFDCRETGPMSSARSCICRLNKVAGYEAFEISTKDNGATYTITHNEE